MTGGFIAHPAQLFYQCVNTHAYFAQKVPERHYVKEPA